MSAIIEVRNLFKRYGEHVAVNGISFDVEQGEVFGLLGPNGAGKSTTIKMLVTLLPPTTGEAEVAGFDCVHQMAAVRRSIGYVPQALSADAALTGYENLLFFASNAIYPIAIMPHWLQVIAQANPLTYVVDGIRMLMLAGSTVDVASLGIDMLVLVAVTTVLIIIASALYPRLIQ